VSCKRIFAILFVALVFSVLHLLAEREPVLKQIDLPHPYYYREMYLPQLTSGPSSVAWSPDSKTLVYSMQGVLWKQCIDSDIAEQLTDSPGYDYQPDWSADGKWVVFARYDNDAMELFLLELITGNTKQITTGGAVNTEPRFSPDGKKLAFVSTSSTKHFHIFLASFNNGSVQKMEQLTKEQKTKISRYYYSPYEHEISPTWSPDSSELIFVSDYETSYGTGGFWRMKAEPGAQPRQIHYEETTWKGRPDWSPDGRRVIFSSYLGRQWHQLWVMTAEGENPFPLSYGDFDVTSARWSPDGKKIAFISNKTGNTVLWVQDILDGCQSQVIIKKKRYLHPRARILLTILDSQGKPTSARVSVMSEDGRFFAPDDAWIHGDDGFDRTERRFEAHYIHSPGKSEVDIPGGKATVEVMKGFEYEFERLELDLKAGENRRVTVQLKSLAIPTNWGNWLNGDLHVHMNYGGSYRNTPATMIAQADAENVHVVFNLIVNKEARVPDIDYFSPKPDPASTPQTILVHSQEFHTSYWGHIGLLNLKRNLIIPDYASYPETAAASPFPTNAAVADLAHAQGALVGYVHPFGVEPDPAKDERLTHELPVDVALGKVDYYEVIGFNDHKSSASVWYRLLNCGFKLPAGAGTDAMANFSSLRGPVGLNRVYVNLDGPFDLERWLEGLRRGKTFATNGPLIRFEVKGQKPGSEIELKNPDQSLEFKASLRSIVPVDHFQIVYNGQIVKDLELQGNKTSGDFAGQIQALKSGWVILRAWGEKSIYPILDKYPYATTSPIYITANNTPARSAKDAAYFIAWISRLIEAAKIHEGYNNAAEKEETLKTLFEARSVFENRK
jgi:TolB protein